MVIGDAREQLPLRRLLATTEGARRLRPSRRVQGSAVEWPGAEGDCVSDRWTNILKRSGLDLVLSGLVRSCQSQAGPKKVARSSRGGRRNGRRAWVCYLNLIFYEPGVMMYK